jgi:E3 ubiquitin-protein ligase NRDP1
VTHWGGMISTPDIVLQDLVKRALVDSGCPNNITDELMENAHERHWPEGLSTLGRFSFRNKIFNYSFLETRQLNRRHYESYICRRIIGKQAVVVLGCDNRHMDQFMSKKE